MLLMAQMVMTVVQSKLVNVGVSPGNGQRMKQKFSKAGHVIRVRYADLTFDFFTQAISVSIIFNKSAYQYYSYVKD
jgi:hypothetical protein